MKSSRFAFAICFAAAIAACNRSPDGAPGAPGAAGAAAGQASNDREDPCRLVSQAEAERHLGPLAHPPFRADNQGTPDPRGNACRYVAQDGRHVAIDVSWTNGDAGMAAISMGGQLAGQIFTDDNGKTDTLEGSWEEARWMGPGSFFALKGQVLVTTDVSGARGGVATAADLTAKAMDRIEQPLAYDGGRAAANAPKPRETGDACALLTSADVAAIAGPVDGAPEPGGQGTHTSCLYHVRSAKGRSDLKVEVAWRDGFKAFAEGKMVMGTVMSQTAGMKQSHAQTGETTKAEAVKQPSATEDPGLGKVLGTLQKLAKTQGVEMNKSGGLVHDTLVTGPWAEGAILGGVSFIAVKNDVLVTLGFQALSIDQAKALMAKIMERL